MFKNKKLSVLSAILIIALTIVAVSAMDFIASKTVTGVKINAENFSDENFRKWILEQNYGNGNNILTDDEISQITKIDVSNKKIASLSGIKYFTALKELNCSNNKLTAISVQELENLEVLYCFNNQLTTLDVSELKNLEWLVCPNNELKVLDAGGLTNLELLSCYNNKLITINVSKSTNLELLDCYNNKIEILDVGSLTNLRELYCYNNQLKFLDVSKLTNLKELDCRFNLMNSENSVIGFKGKWDNNKYKFSPQENEEKMNVLREKNRQIAGRRH